MLTEEQKKAIDKTASMLAGEGWPDHANNKAMLVGALTQVAEHRSSSGGGSLAYINWIDALTALSETCATIAKRERASYNRIRP